MIGSTPVIGITGGPHSGKTEFMKRVKRLLKKLGYTVIIVDETATELILSGITPWDVGLIEFQRQVLTNQIKKEEEAKEAAALIPGKVVIIADRGTMDGAAYVKPEEMRAIWDEFGHHIVDLRDKRYIGIVHLVTTGIGLPHLFSCENNAARHEKTPEQAAALDERTLASWIGCPHLAYVDNSTGFEEKMERAFDWVLSFLGSIENERKWRLLIPFDRSLLPAHAQRIEIRQSYVRVPGVRKKQRIRLRGQDGVFIPFQTEKRHIDTSSSNEKEKIISNSEYAHLHGTCQIPGFVEVFKDRWCFVENGMYWELDVFRDWHEVLLEVEFPRAGWPIQLPGWLEGKAEEVTGLPGFSTKDIARSIATAQAAA